MGRRGWKRGLSLWALVLLWSGGLAVAQAPTPADLEAGEKLYRERCRHCHGEEGDGQGVSTPFVYPKPRAFTSGIYKFRTRHETANGNRLPSDEDLFRSIAEGPARHLHAGVGGVFHQAADLAAGALHQDVFQRV
ncbi:MAG: hypothetical protein KatS3mg131_2333 [Candidatus Tectimicrobiota bacterium]|nr:MAG: hypothetical protein KatS3mg131_2333 [Candidatus Tectomicrobia bacterium]